MTRASSFLLAALACAVGALAGCPAKKGDGHDHAEGGHEEEEGHGGREHGESSDEVRLTKEQLASSDVRTETAGVGSVATTLPVTAVVTADLGAQVHVTPKVPGVVRAVKKQLGQRVAAGDVLCEIDSVEVGQAAAEWVKSRTLLESQRAVLVQEEALLGRRVELAESMLAREERLKSQEIGTVRAFYEAEQKLAETKLDRDRRLLELRASVRQLEVEQAADRSRLSVMGLSREDIERVAADDGSLGGELGRILVRAAAPGLVAARHVTLGEFVEPSDVLFEVHDLSRVWVEARVFEKDLRLVRTGQRACVKLEALPGGCFDGKVALIGASLDRESRAAVVRIELENATSDVWPEEFPIRPGMFGTVELILEERAAPVVLAETAVVHEGPRTFVFVREAEDAAGATFARREVVLRDAGAGRVEVVSGLEAGAVVATSGLFTLKSMARQGELGGGHSH
jgi:cobalt-zinc-cadmium efflux system membrane fusion protein